MSGVGRKRKSPNNKTISTSSKKFKNSENKDDQTVPSINRLASGVGAVADLFNLRQTSSSGIFPSSSTTPPPPPIPEFAFSNMMRKMASKYNINDSNEVLEKEPIIHPYR